MITAQDFANQVAIVTGGSRGIGRAIAQELAQRGSQVAIIDIKLETAAATAAELAEATGNKVKGYQADVSDGAQVTQAFEEILKDFGKIDILVNNAGINRDTVFLRMSDEQWDSVLNIDLKGVFNCCKAATRPMMKARYGRIVSISSVVALLGNAGQANYSAAKAGVIALSKSLAREFASRNILVNCVAPGFINTDMTAALTDEQRAAALTHIPLAKAGTPYDIAKTVAFLASPDNEYITGQVIAVDGGMAM